MNRGFLFLIVVFFIVALVTAGLSIMIFTDNIHNHEDGFHEFYISTGSSYADVEQSFVDQNIVKNIKSFDWVASRMNYPNTVEPGKYIISNSLSNRELIKQLRNGYDEVSVKLPITNIDSKEELFEVVSKTIEADTVELDFIFNDKQFLTSQNLTVDNSWAIVMADTYLFHWDTDGKAFFDRMLSEFKKYWTPERTQKAAAKGLKPIDCIILGSIIEKESTKKDEYPRIAGVYINRLRDNWPLQADPTVKFALNNSEIKRILNKHLEVDSPYNTYKNTGLPPGPIGLPQKTTIESIINAENHEYMYFCANSDFSGYHIFAKSLRDHNKNAKQYQKALNESNIY
ncbi:MAG: endolytic transglycosylase MltG [Chitinophagales bacterium]